MSTLKRGIPCQQQESDHIPHQRNGAR